jgi:phenylpyruvate tautomerase PptA (4-oxalocrotonate tautomerase family)
VIFIEVKHGNNFVSSVPLDTDQIRVEGHLRTGHDVEAKRSLVERIVEAVAQVTAMPKSHVWAHLVDMPASQIVEFGRVVPEPGGEAARIAALPVAERKEIEAIGPR